MLVAFSDLFRNVAALRSRQNNDRHRLLMPPAQLCSALGPGLGRQRGRLPRDAQEIIYPCPVLVDAFDGHCLGTVALALLGCGSPTENQWGADTRVRIWLG